MWVLIFAVLIMEEHLLPLFHIHFWPLNTNHLFFTSDSVIYLSQKLLPGHLQAAILWHWPSWGFRLNQRTLLSFPSRSLRFPPLLSWKVLKTWKLSLLSLCASLATDVLQHVSGFPFRVTIMSSVPLKMRDSLPFREKVHRSLGLDLAAPAWCCDNGLWKFRCCSILGVILGHFRSFNGSLCLHSWAHGNWSTDLAGEGIWKTTLIKW